MTNREMQEMGLYQVLRGPEPKEHGAGYVNIYDLRQDVAGRIEAPGIGVGHKTRKEADAAARLAERTDPRFPRIACKRIEWTEGEFDV
jgi:hypothetical protein